MLLALLLLPAVLMLGGSAFSAAAFGVLRSDPTTTPHFAGTRPNSQPGFECRFTEKPIVIDGKADEEAWRDAQVIDRFGLPWPSDIPRPSSVVPRPSRARLLWDREGAYFFAELDDTDLFTADTGPDGSAWDNDSFGLFLKPASDKPGYFEFQVNPEGKTLDLFHPARESGGSARRDDVDFLWESKVALRGTLNERRDRDSGWSVEGRIPWTDFLRAGGRPAPGEEWRFALCRRDTSGTEKPVLSSSAPFTQPDVHRTEEYVTLRFAGPNSPRAQPYGIEERAILESHRVVGSPDPTLPFRIRRVYPDLKIGSPVALAHEPGSRSILAILHDWKGNKSTLVRFGDRQDIRQVETLATMDSFAYDLTFHPKFQENGYLYLSDKTPEGQDPRKVRVRRFTLPRGQGLGVRSPNLQPSTLNQPGSIVSGSERTIIEWVSDGHDGAALAFGLDGMLYVTSGDGTSDSDINLVGQEMSLLVSKLLRIDVDHPDAGREYSVPKDNPFVGIPNVRPETWAHGFRNPWKMTVDGKTGHVWVGMNGQDLWETAYLIEKGANYGWSAYEGSHPFYPNRKLGIGKLTQPTVEHHHSEARSLTGGIVYYGSKHPELQGAYIYGDYSTGKIWGVRHDGRKILWHRELADTSVQIAAFATDSDGEILIADYRGDQSAIYTLEPTPKDLPPADFPKRLSETGLFNSVKGHVPHPALIPYTVNAPLWSDNAYKERFIALPGRDSSITMTAERGWEFPERSVMVKSFALETREGDASSRRWIETRLLAKEQGEWVGYSYIWNDAQTEAVLADKKGEDREYRGVKWHYPSRAECMVCHSRAANFVLGLSTLQMNAVNRYRRVRDNQLRLLEHLGVLKTDWLQESQQWVRTEARRLGWTEARIKAYLEKQQTEPGQRQPVPSTLLVQNLERFPKLADPSDTKASLDSRARSYLHSNCAQCHVSAGGGNSAIELEYSRAAKDMKLFDVAPLHDTYGIQEAKLVSPGNPDRSVLLHRMTHRDKGHMPPLATSVVDRRAVELMREWVGKMKPTQ